jgi:hypothetical protein
MRWLLGIPFLALLVGPPADAAPFTFATIDRPVGIAVTTSTLYVTQRCSFQITAFDPTGASFVFATLPNQGQLCTERYIALPTPQFGGDLFATQGRSIFRISGGAATRFVKLPLSAAPNGMGITFDTVGTWGGDMIVTSHDGQVWRVSASRSVALVGSVGSQAEGPAVAPLTFSAAPGDVLVANKVANKVKAIGPDGRVTSVASWTTAEKVDVVPSTPCALGGGGPAYVVALPKDDKLIGFRSSDFTGVSGAMVSSETKTTIGNIANNGSVSSFAGPLGTQGSEALEGSDFCGT